MRKLLVAAFTGVAMLATLAVTLPAFAQENCVKETTDWVLSQPDGEGWVQIDQRTVIDVEAVAAQHYVHAHNEGDDPLGNDEVPPTPAEDPSVWQANTTLEPHTQGGGDPAQKPDGSQYTDGDSGLHYVSHGSSGRRDWFYFQPAVAEQSHTEYRYEREVCTPVGEASAALAQGDCENPAVVTLTNETEGDVTFNVNGTDYTVAADSQQPVEVEFGAVLVTVGETVLLDEEAIAPQGCEQVPPPPDDEPPSGDNPPDVVTLPNTL